MKSTILNIKKRVLVVEFEIGQTMGDALDKINLKLDLDIICKGSELTEEILKNIIEPKRISSSSGEIFPDFKNKGWLYGKPNRMRSFISAIEANDFYWKINPFEPKKEKVTMDALYKFQADFDEWQEAESKTFNPDITLLFEIL